MAPVKKFKSGTGGLIPPGPLDPSAPVPPVPAAPSPNRLTPAYPILTEEVGYPPSPVSAGATGSRATVRA
jgi:hypothetical protein